MEKQEKLTVRLEDYIDEVEDIFNKRMLFSDDYSDVNKHNQMKMLEISAVLLLMDAVNDLSEELRNKEL